MFGMRILLTACLSLGLVLFAQTGAIAGSTGFNLIAQASDDSTQPSALPTCAKSDDNNAKLPQVAGKIEVDVPMKKVWAAIQARRTSAHRKLVSYDGKVAVVKEAFKAMPVIGDTSCTYTEQELAGQKMITYKLMNSDHFKKFEGCWQLTPGPKPDTTMVSLSTTLDPGIRFPFWEHIARANMQKNLRENLAEVAALATQQNQAPTPAAANTSCAKN